jgi:hypothetical protein
VSLALIVIGSTDVPIDAIGSMESKPNNMEEE